jgi:hypothetical protein
MSTHLTWANFSSSIIHKTENRQHRVHADPEAFVFADDSGNRIGMLVQENQQGVLPAELARMRLLDVDKVRIGERHFLRACCRRRSFFREAYLLFTAVIDRVVVDGAEPVHALMAEIGAIQELLKVEGVLSRERQIGLFGELLLLDDLVSSNGPSAVASWTGPQGERHDFRIDKLEFEVKTTAGRRRIHTVNGLTQAEPSTGCELSFLSVQLAKTAGSDGSTLPDLVGKVEGHLRADEDSRQMFRRFLDRLGYRDADSSSYDQKWKLATAVKLVPVDTSFPAITSAMMTDALGGTFSRLEAISYDVNLDGLGTSLDDGLGNYLQRKQKEEIQ